MPKLWPWYHITFDKHYRTGVTIKEVMFVVFFFNCQVISNATFEITCKQQKLASSKGWLGSPSEIQGQGHSTVNILILDDWFSLFSRKHPP